MSTASAEEAPPAEPTSPASRPAGELGQIYVGVLVKYVNFGKGWRHRLFVLKAGVLRYYKVFGPNAVNAHALLEKLRQSGEVVKIGSEIEVAESKWKSRSTHSEPREAAPPAAGDIHLQVSKLRQSDSDDRKFYLDTGTVELRLKADTRDDRWAWLQALNAAKSTWEGMSAAQAGAMNLFLGQDIKVKNDDNEFQKRLLDAKSSLKQKGASPAVLDAVEDLLVRQHQTYQEKSAQLTTRVQTLLGYVNNLENEKRQLQTALVVEQRVKSKTHRNMDSFTEKQSVRSDFDSDEVSDDADADPGLRGSASDDDHFVDCEPMSSQALEAAERNAEMLPSSSSSISRERSWLSGEDPPPKRRDRMPPPKQVEKSYSLWSIIKECIGKDLSRVCLPVFFNEPLSALQKSAEDLEYCDLLDKAAEFAPGSWERLLHVACFAVSGYAATANRTSKPFNPLLGETYEFVCPEKGFRFISEKVVHHPTIMAAHCEGRKWSATGDGELRSKFLGPSIQLRPVGITHLTFHDGDEFTWHKVTTSINNIIIGKLNIDHGGVMHVRNLTHGLACKMKFKQPGLLQFRGELHAVEGTVEKNHKALDLPRVEGKWDESLTVTKPDGSREVIWKVSPPAADPTRHNWGTWVMALNELTPGLKEKLAPTDCRLRPDQHYMEVGEFDKANAEKLRLEQKQRAARKAAEEGAPLEPRWFTRIPGAQSGESLTYRYNGGYFEARKEGHFEGCRDIFSDSPVTLNGKPVEVPPVALNK